MYHPQVGELELHYENLQIAGTDEQTLIIYHADSGSHTAQSPELLATLAENRSPSSAPTEKPALTPTRHEYKPTRSSRASHAGRSKVNEGRPRPCRAISARTLRHSAL